MSSGNNPGSVVSRRGVLVGAGAGLGLVAAGAADAQSDGPTERWRYAPGSVSNLVGHDGTYYVVAGETIQAVDATSGRVAWTADAGGPVPDGAFALDPPSGTAVAAIEGGTAVGVALDDGTERWRRSAGGRGIGAVAVDGTAYLLAGSTVQAVDAASGQPTWSHSIPDEIDGDSRGLAVATTDSGPVPVYHTSNYAVGLDGSGNESWRLELSVPAFSDQVFRFDDNNIAAQGQYVYYQSDTGPNDGDRHGLVDAATGTLVWERLDDYTNLSELRGGPATFNGHVVNSGADATVLSVPGGREQWRTGITTYDGIAGTSEALYVAGETDATAVLRSFGPGGTINWTLEFGEYREYDRLYYDEYEFYNVPPTVTDGSIVFGATPEDGERALRCYELPESEWLAEPQRETTATPAPGEDATPAPTTAPPPGAVTDGPPTRRPSSGDGSDRGFFSNGENRPLAALDGANLTLFSTAVTVFGIAVTVYDLIRGGDG